MYVNFTSNVNSVYGAVGTGKSNNLSFKSAGCTDRFEKCQCQSTEQYDTFLKREIINSPKNFDDVRGMEEVKEALKGAILKDGVLLYGPPATGKTFVARALAGETGYPLYNIYSSSFSSIFSKVGNDKGVLGRIFQQLQDKFQKTGEPSILLIEEIDDLFSASIPFRERVPDADLLIYLVSHLEKASQNGIIPILTAYSKDKLNEDALCKGNIGTHIQCSQIFPRPHFR